MEVRPGKTQRRRRPRKASTRIPPWWFVPFATETAQLETPLSVPECEAGLRARTGLWWPINRDFWRVCLSPRLGWEWAARPVAGLVNGKGFAVTKNPLSNMLSRNIYHPEARGRFVSTPSGTRVDIHLGEHPSAVLFDMALFGSWLAGMLAVMVDQQQVANPAAVFLSAAFFWLAFRALLVWSAGDDRAFLIGFLRKTLQAEPTPGESG